MDYRKAQNCSTMLKSKNKSVKERGIALMYKLINKEIIENIKEFNGFLNKFRINK